MLFIVCFHKHDRIWAMQMFIGHPLALSREIMVIPSIQSTNDADFLPSQPSWQSKGGVAVNQAELKQWSCLREGDLWPWHSEALIFKFTINGGKFLFFSLFNVSHIRQGGIFLFISKTREVFFSSRPQVVRRGSWHRPNLQVLMATTAVSD